MRDGRNTFQLEAPVSRRRDQRPEKDADNQHELPVEADLLLGEVLVCRYALRRRRPLEQPGRPHEGGRCSQVAGFPHQLGGRIHRGDSQQPHQRPCEVGVPPAVCRFSSHGISSSFCVYHAAGIRRPGSGRRPPARVLLFNTVSCIFLRTAAMKTA